MSYLLELRRADFVGQPNEYDMKLSPFERAAPQTGGGPSVGVLFLSLPFFRFTCSDMSYLLELRRADFVGQPNEYDMKLSPFERFVFAASCSLSISTLLLFAEYGSPRMNTFPVFMFLLANRMSMI